MGDGHCSITGSEWYRRAGAGERVIFVCDDEELAKAGREENLEVINPRKEEDKIKLKGMLMRR